MDKIDRERGTKPLAVMDVPSINNYYREQEGERKSEMKKRGKRT